MHLMEHAEWFRPGDSVSKNLRVNSCVTPICEYLRNNIVRNIKKQKLKTRVHKKLIDLTPGATAALEKLIFSV